MRICSAILICLLSKLNFKSSNHLSLNCDGVSEFNIDGINENNFYESIEKINEGFNTIVIGTFAIKNIDDVLNFDDSLIEKLSIALDIKDNQIASHGWQETTNQSLKHIIGEYNKRPIHSYFVTDVANDGMLSGLNMETFNSIKKLTDKHITIGGGVKDLNDIELSRSNGFNNVVVGKAIYENKISINSLVQFNA